MGKMRKQRHVLKKRANVQIEMMDTSGSVFVLLLHFFFLFIELIDVVSTFNSLIPRFRPIYLYLSVLLPAQQIWS